MQNTISKKFVNEAISLLYALIAIPTENPPGNEVTLTPVLKKAYASLGMKMRIMAKEKKRANFIGSVGKGKPSIAFITHMDTVPAGNGWTTDPFTPTRKGNKIYGRGANDCKGSFVTSWLAIKYFLEHSQSWQGTIMLVGAADEETGSELGIKYLLEKGFHADFAIVPDGGHINSLILGEKGSLRVKISSYGKQAHASTPDEGINAIDHLTHFLPLLDTLPFYTASHHTAFDGVTKNSGVIQGGETPNMVPAYAFIEVDFRYPLGITKKQIIDDIKQAIKKYQKDYSGSKLILEELINTNPHVTNPKETVVKSFLKSAKKVGIPIKTQTLGGRTDAKHLTFAHIPSVVHNVDDGSHTAHAANEYVTIPNIKKAALLYATILENIFISH